MGNTKSSVTETGQSTVEPEIEEEVEIIEEETVETCECSEDDIYTRGEAELGITEKNGFIAVSDLGLDKLPEDIRDASVLDYIKAQEKLVVHLEIDGENYKVGTGWVCADERCELFESCPLKSCEVVKGQSHKSYGGLYVWTNKHVICNQFEAANCKGLFFYNDPNSLSKQGNYTALRNAGLFAVHGLCLTENKGNKDLVRLKVICHEPELHSRISKYSNQKMSVWAAIPDRFKTKLQKHAIVISHPKGFSKKVSFGELKSLEKLDDEGRKVTKYDSPTFPGSSGAPILTGFYPYRPFTHSTKVTDKKVTKKGGKEETEIVGWYNVSYSY